MKIDKPLKIPADKDVYFTSDTHFYHKLDVVWAKRGYDSIEDHYQGVIDNINSKVGKDDILIHLGDWGLDITQEQFEDSVRLINCENIYYIFGNHNSRIKSWYRETLNEENSEAFPVKYGKISFLGYYHEISYRKQIITLSHFPLYSWNMMNRGSWMIHGHEHGAIFDSSPEGTDGKILDVGIDNFPTPVSFDEVKTIMSNKNIRTVGHHENKTRKIKKYYYRSYYSRDSVYRNFPLGFPIQESIIEPNEPLPPF